MNDSRRGFVPTDERDFNQESLIRLRRAQKDILYLLEQGYPIKNASTFTGNHYMLSERQRLAIVRATAVSSVLKQRREKQLGDQTLGRKVYLDGLNIIISLEVALSKGTLIRCMDTTVRDLAGLRGTYRLIESTEEAIRLIGEKLTALRVEEAVFYLDAPVSNTGRLKQKLLEVLGSFPIKTEVLLVNNADVILEKLENVITTDAIILNKCSSWYNLTAEIIRDSIQENYWIDLS
jgi:Uncharacterized conserved protein